LHAAYYLSTTAQAKGYTIINDLTSPDMRAAQSIPGLPHLMAAAVRERGEPATRSV
jgi:hypothetical protein